MQTLSEKEILRRIDKGDCFECIVAGEGSRLSIRDYVPYICAAIHAGSGFRKDLEKKCLLTPEERRLEEDPYTDHLIEGFPITIIGCDSRYEYDLNRPPEQCVYDTAWGKEVWKPALTDKQKAISREKHALFYRILHRLGQQIIKRFGGCLIIDVHSYNWMIRKVDPAPVFNIGTAQLQLPKWQGLVDTMVAELGKIDLPNLPTTVGVNACFYGRGYLAMFARAYLENTPVLPLEVKKVFMDEQTGNLFPVVTEKIQAGLSKAVHTTVAAFTKKLQLPKRAGRKPMSDTFEDVVHTVDNALFKLTKGIEPLTHLNPANILAEKRQVLAHPGHCPAFRYAQLKVDPYHLRELLYALPVSQIRDPLVRELYRVAIDGFAKKVDLLASIGTPQFLYNSLRQYGEPSPADIANARFLLHAPVVKEEHEEPADVTAKEAKAAFEKEIRSRNIPFKVQLSKRIIAKALVDNEKQTLFLNERATMTRTELNALVHHEFGIHILTTANALQEPLKVLRLGITGSTHTQEGLAILSEYLSGNLTLKRLKILALRVLAVHELVNGRSFSHVYQLLKEDHGCSAEEAFTITTRVFRGGGFTKDHVYLRGFRDILAIYRERSVAGLLVGKGTVRLHDIIDSLVAQGKLKTPTFMPPALAHPLPVHPMIEYLVSGIR